MPRGSRPLRAWTLCRESRMVVLVAVASGGPNTVSEVIVAAAVLAEATIMEATILEVMPMEATMMGTTEGMEVDREVREISVLPEGLGSYSVEHPTYGATNCNARDQPSTNEGMRTSDSVWKSAKIQLAGLLLCLHQYVWTGWSWELDFAQEVLNTKAVSASYGDQCFFGLVVWSFPCSEADRLDE